MLLEEDLEICIKEIKRRRMDVYYLGCQLFKTLVDGFAAS